VSEPQAAGTGPGTFQSSVPVNRSFVIAMALVLVAGGNLFLLASILLTGQLTLITGMVSVATLIIGGLTIALSKHYYQQAVGLLSTLQVILVVAVSLLGFGMTNGPAPIVVVWGVMLAGMTLGRHAATYVMAFAVFLLVVACGLEFAHLAPPPIFSDPAQRTGIIAVTLLLGVGVFYPLIAMFTNMVQTAIMTAQAHAARLETANRHLLAAQEEERRISERINRFSHELAGAATQQAGDANQQAAGAGELSQVLAELDAVAAQITEAVGAVVAAASQAQHSAEHGHTATDEAISAMALIRAQVGTITGQITNLGGQIGQIEEVLQLMDDIAEETRLLALNAAIEAAGAGVAGTRFGVVARSIRDLADRAGQGVLQVQDLINTISSAAGDTMQAGNTGLDHAQRGAELVAQAGEAHKAIAQVVTHTLTLSRTIAGATAQQQSASRQALQSVEQFNESARQNAQASEQLLTMVQQLNTLAEQLALASRTLSAEPR
jgi:methyl-accepting chemotaxis protein